MERLHVNLHDHSIQAFFRENQNLVDWVNAQPLENPVICLGSGHDGIGNLFGDLGSETEPCEIWDWYHLQENL